MGRPLRLHQRRFGHQGCKALLSGFVGVQAVVLQDSRGRVAGELKPRGDRGVVAINETSAYLFVELRGSLQVVFNVNIDPHQIGVGRNLVDHRVEE